MHEFDMYNMKATFKSFKQTYNYLTLKSTAESSTSIVATNKKRYIRQSITITEYRLQSNITVKIKTLHVSSCRQIPHIIYTVT